MSEELRPLTDTELCKRILYWNLFEKELSCFDDTQRRVAYHELDLLWGEFRRRETEWEMGL